MKFGPVATGNALGAVLAHSVTLPDRRLRKGATLGEREIADLAAAGIDTITVARLESGDVDENAAAARLAASIAGGQDVRMSAAHTGRVNLIATAPGLAAWDERAIHAVNAVDPTITVATVPHLHRMQPGGLIATIKIIAYAVPEVPLARAEAAGKDALDFLRPVVPNVALIETDVGAPMTDKGERALKQRLDRLGVGYAGRRIVPHTVDALADALAACEAEAIAILTGSATSDIADTAPEALRQAGGEVSRFGIPVDPGNLLFLGHLAGKPVIGLPGCARSIALNGADWVLERVLCGIPPTNAEIAAMGLGGLLKESPERPSPRRAGPA